MQIFELKLNEIKQISYLFFFFKNIKKSVFSESCFLDTAHNQIGETLCPFLLYYYIYHTMCDNTCVKRNLYHIVIEI